MSQFNQCYACTQPATSAEHVPPRCIFPELKDAGIDYRKNLITVPSCDLHNTAKSHDDEFLLFALVVHFQNNQAGNDHFFTKVMRAVGRAPAAFQKMIADSFPVSGASGEGAALQFNRVRFDREIEMIVRALYFYHTNAILSLPVAVESPTFFILQGSKLVPDSTAVNIAACAREFIGSMTPFEGENPDIFRYRFRNEPAANVFTVEMNFYEHFLVVGNATKGNAEPLSNSSAVQPETSLESAT